MKRSWFALALLVALPFAASASDSPSYSYVEGGYMKSQFAGDADGWAVQGSWALLPNLHAFGGYSAQSSNGEFPADFDQWHVGIGYNHAVKPGVDVVARASYNHGKMTEFDGYPGYEIDTSASGYAVEGGIRASLGAHLEAQAMLGYGDVGLSNGEFYTALGLHAKFNQHWGVAGDVKFISGDTQWFVGPRIRW